MSVSYHGQYSPKDPCNVRTDGATGVLKMANLRLIHQQYFVA